jgi:hypothetical protein
MSSPEEANKSGFQMLFPERNSMITLSPAIDATSLPFKRYRWRMHVSLPFPFPSRTCVHMRPTISGTPYHFEIHNHFNRVIGTIKSGDSGPVYFSAFLEDKRQQQESYPGLSAITREALQSVAIFTEDVEHPNPAEAYKDAAGKITRCFDYLGAFLSACQRAAPYLAAWLVYPVSMLDCGTVYHELFGYCEKHERWEFLNSSVSISMGRQLQHPAFFIDVPQQVDSTSPLDATNELLAESLMSIHRGMTRLAVLNAYTALESFGNVVFTRTKVALMVSKHVPEDYATEIVEDERKRHRTEGNFLFHRGIKAASGRSLMEEDKSKYDYLLKLQELRHKVAHTGYRPTVEEARDAQRICSEAVQWFAGVAGLPVKPLMPRKEESVPRVSAAVKDAFAQNPTELAYIQQLLGNCGAINHESHHEQLRHVVKEDAGQGS